jgi:hypothetical protein
LTLRFVLLGLQVKVLDQRLEAVLQLIVYPIPLTTRTVRAVRAAKRVREMRKIMGLQTLQRLIA